MNSILKIFLLLSVSGKVLIIILFSFKSILKNKMSKQLQYYIWLIVIIRLLFPFYIKINLNKPVLSKKYYKLGTKKFIFNLDSYCSYNYNRKNNNLSKLYKLY